MALAPAPHSVFEQYGADQIVEETRDWPEDAIADLVDRRLRARSFPFSVVSSGQVAARQAASD